MKKQKSKNGLTRKTHLQSFLFHLALKIICPRREREELALGLLLSKVNFIRVLRFAQGEKISAKEALPEGFFDMVGERGLIVEEWAPQKRISSHHGIGGFLSHCGWNSVLESMRFGDPIIALPLNIDQPLNAGFVVEVGAGLEIKGYKNGMSKNHFNLIA